MLPANHLSGQTVIIWKAIEKDNSVSIHQKNLQSPATEMYKISNVLFPTVAGKGSKQ